MTGKRQQTYKRYKAVRREKLSLVSQKSDTMTAEVLRAIKNIREMIKGFKDSSDLR